MSSERHYVPRLEVGDHPGLHVGMCRQEVIQSRNVRLAQCLDFRLKRFVVGLRAWHDLEGTVQQIRIQALGSQDLGVASQSQYVRVLDLPEEILGLCVGKTEDYGGVVRAVDMRRAERVAVYRYALCQA